MIETLSRRLRVRDDGTGKERDSDGSFAEFGIEDAVILLGNPGMGKTTLFRDASHAKCRTVRDFLIAPSATAGEPLFLDALDEYRTLANGQDASAEVAKALCFLNKPRFRLSCRAADWYGSLDQEALKTASASGRVVVLELRPLSHDEILNAVQGMVPDPAIFLDEAESAGLGDLLGNPQTLELIARAWGTGKKPRNKFEAYEIGVSELLKETNAYHVPHGVASPDRNDLRKAAGAAASTLLLSNSVGIWRAESAEGNGYIGLSVLPYPNKNDLDAVLRRRIFISSAVNRFEPVHRTIAEFLAAEDLSQRIEGGLPIDRVMALICGVDGRPVSSLRGLFAWLMCRLGPRAEDFVERDPYGVTTYGDASVLPPSAQRTIWTGLRKLRDPWFLANEDDRGSFHNLANPNTVTIITEILQGSATGVHLKIAALEAIANSTGDIELNTMTRDMVLEKHDNTWLRSTALRAFAKSVLNDWQQLEALDGELAQATDDPDAPEVRIKLLRLTQSFGSLTSRLLSITKHAASARREHRSFGSFYTLIDLPSDADLDVILDHASDVLTSESADQYELQLLFAKWLKRRLKSSTPITSMQLASWLHHMQAIRDHYAKDPTASLKMRFEQEPSLFDEVFELLAHTVPEPNEERSFWLFVAYHLWKLLPATVWPVPQSEFFLTRAEREHDPKRAADLFWMYLARFPLEGASATLAESGFDLLERRPDIAGALGNWQTCEIEKWRKDQWMQHERDRRKYSANCNQRVANLTPRLTTIREGGEEDALAWAAMVYQGFFYDIEHASGARERLVSVTNDEIADACIEGFIRYAENPTIPKKEAVLEKWLENKIPGTHSLLSLSVFLRLKAGMTVSEEALPHAIAAVVTALNLDNIPGYNETLSSWVLEQARQHPDVIKAVLREVWLASSAAKRGSLPGFYEFSRDPDSQQFLASVSAEVLKARIHDDHETVNKLVSVLLRHAQRTALTIGENEIARDELSSEVRAIWHTALIAIDPDKCLEPWRNIISAPDAALWAVIDILGGSLDNTQSAISLTSAQRTEVVISLGKRFANVERPLGGSTGSHNPWDASEFVANQIKLVAADGSADVESLLARLEDDVGLASYRDVIRHYRAQREKQQRDASFAFAPPEQVAEAIQNRAPATPNDLLAFIVDHLNVLASELVGTPNERYRAYWNESGRSLVEPKREEVCTGFLAQDLQNRIQAHHLIVTVERHMVADKECDLVVSQGTERLLPIEAKHHYHRELWTAWHTQLDRLYTRDAQAGGLGIYLIFWSGETEDRRLPQPPKGLTRPASAAELKNALESLIPEEDKHRLRVVVMDISVPSS